MWAFTGTGLPLLAWLAIQAPLSAESAVLLAAASPLLAYLIVRSVEVPVRADTGSPFQMIGWDCVDVVAVPLAILTPPALAAACVSAVSLATVPLGPSPPDLRNRAYSATVQGFALYCAGEAALRVVDGVGGAFGVCIAVAVGVLVYEALTFVGHVAFLPRGDRQIRFMFGPVIAGVPLVIAVAIGITLSYEHGAYVAAAVLALIPVVLIEVLRHFGRTSIDLEERNRERGDILRAVIEAAELQRTSLAAEVHDGPLQSVLACQAMLTDIAEGSVDSDALARARGWLQISGEELRALVRGLVPEALAELGLEGAIARDARMLERFPLQKITVESCVESRLSPTAEAVLYRVAHEALMNAVKHSEASRIIVSVSCRDGEATLSVEDDGRGGAAISDDAATDGHVGLAMVRDRILLAGGQFHLGNGADGGTKLSVLLPTAPQGEPKSDSRAARLARWWAAPVDAQEITADR